MHCPECHGTLVFPSGLKGEIVCKRCGLVISRSRSNQGFTRWTPRWFSNWDKKDSNTLREWLTTLRAVSCQLHLPNFPYREEAARLIRQNSDKFFRSQRLGKNKRVATAALVHIVLREYGNMRSLKEICRELSLDHRKVMKYAWTMRKMTKYKRTFSAQDYLREYGWKLTSDARMIKASEQLLKSIRGEISGHPASLAAGCFYFVCKSREMNISRDEIGEAFHISSRTIYRNMRRISKLLNERPKNKIP